MKPNLDYDLDMDDVLNDSWEICKGDLWHYAYAIIHAKSASNPYHNARHPLHTTWLLYQACRYLVEKKIISRRDARNVLIAGMLHDIRHSGLGTDRVPDHINIANAVQALKEIALPRDRLHIPAISSYMWATEFPHRPESESGEITLLHELIRDCDTAQVFSDSWIQQVLIGLSAEWDIEPIEMLTRQLAYLKNLAFTTTWAQQAFPTEVIRAKCIVTEVFLKGMRSVTTS